MCSLVRLNIFIYFAKGVRATQQMSFPSRANPSNVPFSKTPPLANDTTRLQTPRKNTSRVYQRL